MNGKQVNMIPQETPPNNGQPRKHFEIMISDGPKMLACKEKGKGWVINDAEGALDQLTTALVKLNKDYSELNDVSQRLSVQANDLQKLVYGLWEDLKKQGYGNDMNIFALLQSKIDAFNKTHSHGQSKPETPGN